MLRAAEDIGNQIFAAAVARVRFAGVNDLQFALAAVGAAVFAARDFRQAIQIGKQ